MDKIKETLNRHQVFWSVVGVVALLGLVAWILAISSLASQTKKFGNDVTTNLGIPRNIGTEVDRHPNKKNAEQVEQQADEDRQTIRDLWKQVYEKQQEAVFVWPKRDPAYPNRIGFDDGFILAVQKLKPGQELPPAYLDFVLNEGRKWFTELVERTKLGVDKAHPMTGAPEKLTFDDKAVDEVNKRHFDFPLRPSTQRALYAMEDYWVLEALCESLIAANASASGKYNAVVDQVNAMRIGANAADDHPGGIKENRIKRFSVAAGAGNLNIDDNQANNTSTNDSDGNKPTADQLLKDKRYVDAQRVPQSWNQEPMKEYRLMPFELDLSVDQRKLSQLLAALANSPLPLKVMEVRLDPAAAGRGGRQAAPRVAAGTGGDKDTGTRHHRRYVIAGVAYLIKPVDYEYLGLPKPEPPPELPAEGIVGNPDATTSGDGGEDALARQTGATGQATGNNASSSGNSTGPAPTGGAAPASNGSQPTGSEPSTNPGSAPPTTSETTTVPTAVP